MSKGASLPVAVVVGDRAPSAPASGVENGFSKLILWPLTYDCKPAARRHRIGLSSNSSSVRVVVLASPIVAGGKQRLRQTPTHVAQARGHAAAHAWLVARGGVATAPAKKQSSFSFSPKKLSPKKSPSK